MTAPRRLACLLTAAVLAVAPAAPALAQSAGDEQYSDPFGGTSTTQDEQRTTPSDAPPLATTPATPAPSPSQAPAAAASPSTGAAPAAPAQLPNTGVDARVVALLGVALVLLGIGLRLRTADARP